MAMTMMVAAVVVLVGTQGVTWSLCWKILPIHNTIGYQRMKDPQYCPNLATLQCNLYSLAIWGESVKGVVDLKVKSISAYNCFSFTEFSASQGSVSIQQVSPTNSATVKTIMTTVMSASTTASTQGSQQVMASGDEIVLEDFVHPVNAWVTCHISRLLCEFWYHSFARRASCSRIQDTHTSSIPSKGKEEDDFGEVLLPFSSFSAKQDEVMGKTLAPCSPENLQCCPDVDILQDMKAMSIWGRGVEGAVDLEI